MKIHDEFEKFLKERDVFLTKEQREVADLVLGDNRFFWMRGRKTGVTYLFDALESFYKTHTPTPE